jgi:hypothetical protein
MTICERAVLDELPGVVQKRCRTCGDWWPDDAEFFKLTLDGRRPRPWLSGVCLACASLGETLEYTRPRALGLGDRWCRECRLPLAMSARYGPPALYCSSRCRQRPYRRNRHSAALTIAAEIPPAELLRLRDAVRAGRAGGAADGRRPRKGDAS